MVQIIEFLKEVRAELNKVEWPKTNEFIGSVIVTFVMVTFFTIFLGIVDKIAKWIIYNNLFSRIGK